MLQISKIQKYFGSYHASKDISFEVKPGTIFGLLGPNGAGKTTLIRMINGIYQPDSGDILWNNSPISIKTSNRIGYLPEERGLYPKMSVLNTLLYFAEIKGVPSSPELLTEIHEYLHRFGIAADRNKRVEQLSKGMQQKVQIIGTLLHNPELLILDEPFTGLDPVNTRVLKSLIKELALQGKTIILSTHRMEQVEELCEEIVLIHQGALILSGKVRDLKLTNRTQTYILKTLSHLPSSIPGTILDQKDSQVTFQTSENITAFMKKVFGECEVLEFREVLPTLDDIFIQTVQTR